MEGQGGRAGNGRVSGDTGGIEVWVRGCEEEDICRSYRCLRCLGRIYPIWLSHFLLHEVASPG